MPIDVAPALDRTEALLWTILHRFESLAAEQYVASAATLLTAEKRAVVGLLQTRIHSDSALDGTTLAAPLAALIGCVRSSSEAHVLVVQGLLLELMGGAIYRTFGENDVTSPTTRELCSAGLRSSEAARALVPSLLAARVGRGDVLLQALMTEAGPFLRSLDPLGEAIDASFGERFSIGFADLMGDVAADLIATCIDLDVDRRKLVSFLTGALMGV